MYDARVMYQLVAPTYFQDEVLCAAHRPAEGRAMMALRSPYQIIPNPASDAFLVKGLSDDCSVQITLFNAAGQVCQSRYVDHAIEVSIPILDLAAGIYYCQIAADLGVTTHKLVISR